MLALFGDTCYRERKCVKRLCTPMLVPAAASALLLMEVQLATVFQTPRPTITYVPVFCCNPVVTRRDFPALWRVASIRCSLPPQVSFLRWARLITTTGRRPLNAATAPSATRDNRAGGWDRRGHGSVGGRDGGARGVCGARGSWRCSEGCNPRPVGQSPREEQVGVFVTTDKDLESFSARGSNRAFSDAEEDGCTNGVNAPGQREQLKKRKRLLNWFCFLGEFRSTLEGTRCFGRCFYGS